MATQIYIINNTQGTILTSLQPGVSNGPGSAQQTSDLKLFGLGTQRWGEGFDENFVRLIENFACPQKPSGFPKDSTDLGVGNGINNPLPGQIWFNTTDSTLRVFDGVVWNPVSRIIVSATQPSSPQTGDLWFDTTIPQQLKIFDGVSFVSVADRYVLKAGDVMDVGSFLILGSSLPTNPLHAASKGYVDAAVLTGGGLTPATADPLYVNVIGDTMTGPLAMSLNQITSLGAPTLSTDAATKGYVDTAIAGVPVGITQAAADIRYVNVLGDSMSGVLSMTNNKITVLGTPTIGTDAATKAYVDSTIAAAIAPFSSGLSGTFVNATGSRMLNSTYTNSFGKDILVVVTTTATGIVPYVIRGVVNGTTIVEQSGHAMGWGFHVAFVVDAGFTYRVNTVNTGGGPAYTLTSWREYR
ncbi:MAG: hypothetical protein ACREAU_01285 [Nitrosopumilaceae archaeon]